MLSSEIERQSRMVQNKNDELNRLKAKIANMQEQIDAYRSLEAEKQVLENKVAMLSTEIERQGKKVEQRDGRIKDLGD